MYVRVFIIITICTTQGRTGPFLDSTLHLCFNSFHQTTPNPHFASQIPHPTPLHLAPYSRRLRKDNSLAVVKEQPLLSIPLDSRRQHLALDVGALIHQDIGSHAVIDSGDPLLDNRALIQVRRNKVSSGTDNLDASVVCLMVGLGALERRQERVVDVDDASGHGLAQGGREDLHVAGEHDELDAVLLGQLEDLALLLGLGLLGDGQVVELDAVGLGERLKGRVVGHDERDVDGELTGLGAEEQVVEAVADLGHHDQDPRLLRDGPDLVLHLVLGRELVEGLGQVLGAGSRRRAKVHAHEELFRHGVGELLEIENVVALLREHASDGVDDTRLVRA